MVEPWIPGHATSFPGTGATPREWKQWDLRGGSRDDWDRDPGELHRHRRDRDSGPGERGPRRQDTRRRPIHSSAAPRPALATSSPVTTGTAFSWKERGRSVRESRETTSAPMSMGTAKLGNHLSGVTTYRTTGVLVGGSAPGEGNVVSGNGHGTFPFGTVIGSGVLLQGPDSTGNVVQGNLIGTDATGTVALGNAVIGVMGLRTGRRTTSSGAVRQEPGTLISGSGWTTLWWETPARTAT